MCLTVLPDESGGFRVWMAAPLHPWKPSPLADAALFALLGGTVGTRDSTLPVEQAGHHLYVSVKSRRDLWNLAPQWDALAREGENTGARGVYVFSRDVLEPGSVTHGRYFVPSFGIREDPVTGSASGPLAEYLARHGVLTLPARGGTVRARAEQGDAMG